MKKLLKSTLWGLALMGFTISCEELDFGVPKVWNLETIPACPVFTAIENTSARYGEVIKIKGDHFKDSILVEFPNGSQQLAKVIDVNNLEVTVPKGAEDGTVYLLDRTGCRVPSPTSFDYLYTYTISLLAGNPTSVLNFKEGTGSSAVFAEPKGIDVDNEGNVFLADSENNIIRKIDTSGTALVFAGKVGVAGCMDHPEKTAAKFSSPNDVAISSDGTLYVIDFGCFSVRKIPTSGAVECFSGHNEPLPPSNYNINVDLKDAKYTELHGLAISLLKYNKVFFTDAGEHDVLYGIDEMEGLSSIFAGGSGEDGYVNEEGDRARFDEPNGIDVALGPNPEEETIYVAD